jgi:hypothetical protein
MNRSYEIRVSPRVDKLLQLTRIMMHAEEGRKLTKAAMAERLIDAGVGILLKQYGWEIPDDLRP